MGVRILLFNEKGELLILKPTYKDHWTIPGGVVDKNESIRQAAEREIEEEIGLRVAVKQLLFVDYIFKTKEKDENLQFIFYGGELDEKDINEIKLQEDELSEYKFLKLGDAQQLLGNKLAKRISSCEQAIEKKLSTYLENGERVGYRD